MTDTSGITHFRICFQVLDALLAASLESGSHWEGTASPITIRVDKRKTDGRTDQTFLLASTARPVPEQARTVLAGLEQKQAADDIKAEAAKLPEVCRQIHDELYAGVQRWGDLMRWRLGLSTGPQQALAFRSLEFSHDRISWRPVPNLIRLEISFGLPFGTREEIVPAVARLWEGGESEPVSRAMFREAWYIKDSNPRSALVIGYAAAEVGCKEFIGKVVPQAKWLAMEAPTPPLAAILKNYLPTLPTQTKTNIRVSIPKPIRSAVDGGMKARNDLAHSGILTLARDELTKILRQFNDLLWLLDFYSGQEWALEHISVETRRSLSI